MQTKDVERIKIGTEVVFIPRNQHNRSRHEKELSDFEPTRVRRGTLVSYKHLSVEGSWWLSDKSEAQLATDRVFGFMIECVNHNGDTVYTVVKATNIVSTTAEYDAYWIDENIRRANAQAEAEQRALEYREKQIKRSEREQASKTAVEAEAERLAVTVSANILQLLGQRAYTTSIVSSSVKGEWMNFDTPHEEYRITNQGSVTLDLRDFQRLLEMAIAE
jgi:hypothetical protein